ncbi:hypothetical protein BC832DRAFT_207774 [Gaertneriomyces semiglobifer]|nr:hypothetical protein BC832DRAFT_207774 [Gaertneriomyces semiglobifer]
MYITETVCNLRNESQRIRYRLKCYRSSCSLRWLSAHPSHACRCSELRTRWQLRTFGTLATLSLTRTRAERARASSTSAGCPRVHFQRRVSKVALNTDHNDPVYKLKSILRVMVLALPPELIAQIALFYGHWSILQHLNCAQELTEQVKRTLLRQFFTTVESVLSHGLPPRGITYLGIIFESELKNIQKTFTTDRMLCAAGFLRRPLDTFYRGDGPLKLHLWGWLLDWETTCHVAEILGRYGLQTNCYAASNVIEFRYMTVDEMKANIRWDRISDKGVGRMQLSSLD